MVIEEYYDNILYLSRLEKELNNILNHQLYIHYNFFARIQSTNAALYLFEKKNDNSGDQNTLEYAY